MRRDYCICSLPRIFHTRADSCLLYKRVGYRMIFRVVHVDDFAIAASNKALIDEFYTVLGKSYESTQAESLESYLGIHIDYLSDGNMLLTHSLARSTN